jgi:small subunit ribosomal protein S6
VPGEAIDNYEVELKRDERIMRFLTVRLDKYGVAYAEKRRKKVKANA